MNWENLREKVVRSKLSKVKVKDKEEADWEDGESYWNKLKTGYTDRFGCYVLYPYSVFRVPCSMFRVLCSVFRVPCSVFRVP